MAKKGIVLSNGDGKVTFSVTSSAYIEDTDNSLNVSTLSASNLSLEGLPSGIKLLKSTNNSINDITSSTSDNTALVWSGTEWTTSSLTISEYSGTVGGDLSGTFPNVYVKNISNVSSGTLPVARGGTGLSITGNSNTLLKVSGSTFSTISVNANMSEFALQSINNEWRFAPSINKPRVYFYTASADTANGGQTSYTWTKPAGHSWVRVILQGAGGGGSAGHSYPGGAHQGRGGGSGGYSEKIYNFSSISDSIIIYVGKGGLGGAANTVTGENVWIGPTDSNSTYSPGTTTFVGVGKGGSGGMTWFGGILTAQGGTATLNPWEGPPGFPASGLGGEGSVYNGSAGGYNGGGTVAGAGNTNNSSGGGSGGGGLGGTITLAGISNYSRNFLHTVDFFGNAIDAAFGQGATGAIWNNINTQKPNATAYGAGGGGGAAVGSTGQSAGGNGGDGFALIISW